jgi:hypothetical protein
VIIRCDDVEAQAMEILSLRRPCPKCLADATEPCKDEAGIVIEEVHSERWPTKVRAPGEDVHQSPARTAREATKRR